MLLAPLLRTLIAKWPILLLPLPPLLILLCVLPRLLREMLNLHAAATRGHNDDNANNNKKEEARRA